MNTENAEHSEGRHPARYWHRLEDGRIQCDLCPRDCRLNDGQRGACFVRQRVGDEMVLTTYGRSSGFCVDPIEKKPLNHFYPGSSVLSFGTAGCNLACKFCQNWDISKSREMDRLQDQASPTAIAQTAQSLGCKSLEYIVRETSTWLEITTLLIPGHNDSEDEIRAECAWIMEHLGPDVPLHFSAFHPDYRMPDVPPTPAATLTRARQIALEAGLHYVYTGNVHDAAGDTTYCPGCGAPLITRDWYEILSYHLTPDGHCPHCQYPIAGRFESQVGRFGRRRIPLRMGG